MSAPQATEQTEIRLFAFEMPTPKGTFRIIGPDNLTRAEARALGRKFSAVIEAMFTEEPFQTVAPPSPRA